MQHKRTEPTVLVDEIVRYRCPWKHRLWVENYRNGVRDALADRPSSPPRGIALGDPHVERMARAYATGYRHGMDAR